MQTPTRAFQALHEVAVAAAGLRDPNALAALVVDRARDLLEADAAALYWFFPDTGTLRTLAHNDPREYGAEPPFSPGEGAAGRAYAEAAPVRVDDYRSWPHALPSSVGRGIESGLAVPLTVSQRAVGSLGVFNRRTRVWTADEEQLLMLFAAQVAPAMEAARLTQETIEQAHNFRALHEVAIAAGGLRDLAELGRLVVDRARQLLKSERATLRWWDGNAWTYHATKGGVQSVDTTALTFSPPRSEHRQELAQALPAAAVAPTPDARPVGAQGLRRFAG